MLPYGSQVQSIFLVVHTTIFILINYILLYLNTIKRDCIALYRKIDPPNYFWATNNLIGFENNYEDA